MLNTQKINKRDPLKVALVNTGAVLTGGMVIFGRIGSGKTTAMLTMAQKYHDHPERKYKIFDMWAGRRNESYYWSLPSVDVKYWKVLKKKLRLSEEGPKQYRVNLLYPYSTNLPEKLPYLEQYVFPKVFQIPIKEIKIEDIKLVLGTISMTDETGWLSIQSRLKKTDGIGMLQAHFEKEKMTGSSIYSNFFQPLMEANLLCSSLSVYALKPEEEARDREAISVLCIENIDTKLKLFIVGYIMRKISDALIDGKIQRKNIFLFREVTEFFRTDGKAVIEERIKAFKIALTEWIRYGRNGMHLFLDAQSPSETQGLVEDSEDFKILGRLRGESDKSQATDQLRKDGIMTPKQVMELSLLKPGEYFIISQNGMARKQYFFLPRTMYWREGYGSFTDVWKKYRGSGAFKDISLIREAVKAEINEEKHRLEEDKKIRIITEESKRFEAQKEQEERELINIKERTKKIEIMKRKARQEAKAEVEEMPKVEKPKKEKIVERVEDLQPIEEMDLFDL